MYASTNLLSQCNSNCPLPGSKCAARILPLVKVLICIAAFIEVNQDAQCPPLRTGAYLGLLASSTSLSRKSFPQDCQSSPHSSQGCCVRSDTMQQSILSAAQYLSHPQHRRSGLAGRVGNRFFTGLAVRHQWCTPLPFILELAQQLKVLRLPHWLRGTAFPLGITRKANKHAPLAPLFNSYPQVSAQLLGMNPAICCLPFYARGH